MEATKRCRSVVIFAIFFGMACLPAKAVDKAMVTFTFDDGYRSLYTRALPALSRYGYPATAYIISGNVGDGYAVTWSHLWQLYWNYGWEIGNHTQYHPDLTTLLCAQSDFSIIQEIRGARSDLEKHGLLNVTSLAYPYGSFDVMTGGGNTDVVGCVKNDGTLYSGRAGGQISDGHFTNRSADFDQWRMNTVPIDQVPSSTVNQWIAAAISEKSWIVLLVHDVVTGTPQEYETSATEFSKVIAYINSNRSKIDVVTVSRGVARMLNYNSPPANLAVPRKPEANSLLPPANIRVPGARK